MTVGYSPVDDDLYRELILDHFRHPRHHGPVEGATLILEASNPLCGDELVLSVRREGDAMVAVGFEGQGCSISQASASMMCEGVSGSDVATATDLVHRFRAMLLEQGGTDDLGDLEALQGVRQYPVRIKCAVLAWNALLMALTAEPAPAAVNGGPAAGLSMPSPDGVTVDGITVRERR